MRGTYDQMHMSGSGAAGKIQMAIRRGDCRPGRQNTRVARRPERELPEGGTACEWFWRRLPGLVRGYSR